MRQFIFGAFISLKIDWLFKLLFAFAKLQESKTLLKRTTIIFLILQALTLAVRFKYGYMYSTLAKNPFDPTQPEPSKPDIYRRLGLSILATGAYLLILFLYVRKLESSFHVGRVFRPNTTATHIPLSTTNVGWYGQSHSSRSSRGNNNNGSGSGALYSPLNFFGGVVGFNPLVWTNPGPPPPYSDSAPSADAPINRNIPAVHPHATQPCSSRTMMTSSTGNDNTESKILNNSRTSERTEPGDPSVVPLLEDESEDKNGLEC